jgi:hypothetical protein
MSLEVLSEEYEALSSIFPEELTSARLLMRRNWIRFLIGLEQSSIDLFKNIVIMTSRFE